MRRFTFTFADSHPVQEYAPAVVVPRDHMEGDRCRFELLSTQSTLRSLAEQQLDPAMVLVAVDHRLGERVLCRVIVNRCDA
jgi:hypothetical protein